MKNPVLAGLLALPPLLAVAGPAVAQYPGFIPPPGCGPGYGSPAYGHQLPCPNYGCGGFCMNLFGRIHFHGPLFNYGPYYGYYPFEPYGPWTSDLRYNPPMNCGKHGLFGHGCGNDGWGRYALDTLKNVFHRVNPLGHKCGGGLLKKHHGCDSEGCAAGAADGGCSTCSATAVLTGPSAPGVANVPTTAATGLLTGLVK